MIYNVIKTLVYILILVSTHCILQSQNTSALMDLESEDKGFLMPQMSSSQRNAINNPDEGLQVYDLDTESIWFYNGSIWINTMSSTENISYTGLVNLAIPDIFPLTAELVVTENSIIRSDTEIRVCINITHHTNEELNISLIGSNNFAINLSSGNGGTSDNYFNTCFTTSAATPITSGIGPFTGDYSPETSFSPFIGFNTQGIWKIQINDMGLNFPPNLGQFNFWSIEFLNKMDTDIMVEDFYGNKLIGNGSALTNLQVDDADNDPNNVIQAIYSVLLAGNDANQHVISGVSNPINATDAATKDYVDREEELFPALNTGWANYGSGFESSHYYKDNKRVYLSGRVAKVTPIAASDVIFTLPVGYRPSGQVIFDAQQENQTTFRLDVKTNGDVVIVAGWDTSTNWLSLSGISFRVD